MDTIIIDGVRITAPRGMMMMSRVAQSPDIVKNVSLSGDTFFRTGDILPSGDITIQPGTHTLSLTIDCDVPQLVNTFVRMDVELVAGSDVVKTYNITRSVIRVGSLLIDWREQFVTSVPTLLRIKMVSNSDEIRLRGGTEFEYYPIVIKIKSLIQKTG